MFFFADGRGRDPGPQAAIVKGNYKLLYSWATASAAVFDVSRDIRETSDISAENPDLANNLRQELMDHLRTGIGDAALARAEAGDTPDSRAGASASAARGQSPTADASAPARGPEMTRWYIALCFLAALALSAAAERSRDSFVFEPETVARSFRPFHDDVNVRWDERHFFVESDGMPGHTMMVGIRAWNRQVPVPQPYRGDNAFRFPFAAELR